MTGKVTRNGRISALALLALVAAAGVAYAAIPPKAASAPPASETGAGYRPSEWSEASDRASSGNGPSLTSEAMEPESRTGSQLRFGFGLLGLGLLVLAGALAVTTTKRRSARTRPVAYAGSLGSARHPAAQAGARGSAGRDSRTSHRVLGELPQRAAGQSE